MRYRGGGVGHKSFQKAIRKFCDDRWPDELKGIAEHITTEDHSEIPMDSDVTEEDSDTAGGSNLEPTLDPDADDIELSDDEAELDSDLEQDQSECENANQSESENEADQLDIPPDYEGGDDDNLGLEYADY